MSELCSNECTTTIYDDVVEIICSLKLSRTLAHHALLVFNRIYEITKIPFHAREIAAACLLFALKERNRSQLTHEIHPLLKKCEETHVVALELLLVETVRCPTLLIEGCVRSSFKTLITTHPELIEVREDIIKTALILIEKLYKTSYCLNVHISAIAALSVSCKLLDLCTISDDDKIKLFQPFTPNNTKLTEIEEYLLSLSKQNSS